MIYIPTMLTAPAHVDRKRASRVCLNGGPGICNNLKHK